MATRPPVTGGKPGPRARRGRRAALIAASVLAALILTWAFAWPSTRRWVGQQALIYTSDLLRGDLRAQRVTHLSPWRVRLEGVVIRAPDGQPVITARSLEASVRLGELFSNRLVLENVRAQGVWVSLRARLDDPQIAQTFFPVEEGADDEQDTPSDFSVRVRDIRVRDARIEDLPDGLGVSVTELLGEVEYDDAAGVRVRARASALDVRRAAQKLAAGTLALDLSLVENEHSDASLSLRSGDSSVELALGAVYARETFEPRQGRWDLKIDPSLPARLGHSEWAGYVRSPVRLVGELKGTAEQTSVTAKLHTAGGEATLEAQRDAQQDRLRVQSEGLDLGPTLEWEAPGPLVGDLLVSLEREADAGDARAWTLRSKGVRVGAFAAPDASVWGELSRDALTIQGAEVPSWTHGGGSLDVSARVGFDGDVKFRTRARLRPPLLGGMLSRRTGVRGDGLTVRAAGQYDHERGTLNLDGHVRASDLRADGFELASLQADVVARGPVLRPTLDATLRLEALRAGGARVSLVEARVVGRGEYEATLKVRGDQARADGKVRVRTQGPAVVVAGDFVGDGPAVRRVRLHIDELSIGKAATTLRGVQVRAGSGVLRVDGTYRFRRSSDLRVAMSGFDLEALSSLPVVERWAAPYAPRGVLSGNVRLRGSVARPQVDAALRGDRLGVKHIDLGHVTARAHYASVPGELRAELRFDPPGADRFELDVQGDLPPRQSPRTGLARGDYVLRVDGLMADVSAYRDLLPASLATLSGGVELEGDVRGGLDGLDGTVVLDVTRLQRETWGPVSAQARFELSHERTHLTATLEDEQGTLAVTTVDVERGLHALRDPAAWPQTPWRLQASVPPRRLDRLPPPARVDVPLRVGTTLDAAGSGARLHRVRGDVDARWERDVLQGVEGAECEPLLPSLRLHAELEQGQLSADGRMGFDDRDALTLHVHGRLPEVPLTRLDEWKPRDANVTLEARAQNLDMASLPGVCRRARGLVNASLQARGLLSGKPDVRLEIDAVEVGGPQGPSLDLHVTGKASQTGVQLQATALDGDVAVLHGQGSLPWQWSGLAAPTGLGPPRLSVKLAGLSLTPFAAPFASYGRARGKLHGELSIRREDPRWRVAGRLRLEHVHVALADPALRLEDLNGQVSVKDDVLRFDDLRWGDREGRLRTSGEVHLEGLAPASASLDVVAHDLPLRAEGVPFAYIDTDTHVTADFEQEPAQVHVDIRDLTVQLPEDLMHSTQELEQHPDVIYEDVVEGDPAIAATAQSSQDGGARLVARLTVSTRKPFWVRHQDFAIQIEPQIEVLTEGGEPRVSGPLVVHRGYVNLVGRTFNFQRGELRFDGGKDLDPTVALKARHDLGGGVYVQAEIGGRLSEPTLTFSTNAPGVGNNESEIMALLVRGNTSGASASASQEAAAMLAGVTAGFLSSLTRGKYGQYVPVLALEAGTGTGTRLRAGVQMDDFVPKRWRSVVQGAYVEGYVGSGKDAAAGANTGNSGFLIELYMPHDLITSGAWDEPNNWSLDLLWEPLR